MQWQLDFQALMMNLVCKYNQVHAKQMKIDMAQQLGVQQKLYRCKNNRGSIQDQELPRIRDDTEMLAILTSFGSFLRVWMSCFPFWSRGRYMFTCPIFLNLQKILLCMTTDLPSTSIKPIRETC